MICLSHYVVTASLHQVMESTGYASPSSADHSSVLKAVKVINVRHPVSPCKFKNRSAQAV